VSLRVVFVCSAILLLLSLPGWGSEPGLIESLLIDAEQLGANTTSRLTLLVLIAAATLISEDLACIAAGLLAARAIISPFEAVLASALGIYIGDVLLYLVGYLVGSRALQLPPLKWLVSEQRVLQCRRLFERRGLGLIFMSRFLPGTRTATFLAAGTVRVDMVKLLIVFAAAVLVWTPVLVLSAALIGKKVIDYLDIYSSWAVWVFLALLVALFILFRVLVPLLTWRGRRLLLGRWRRLTNWEFWPFYITNSVTFAYVLYLGCIRYRSLILFTITNPAIRPDSGFVGESKSDIIRGLAQESVGAWRLVPAHTPTARRVELLEEFMAEEKLDFPVVLKPDIGERGQGVAICRDHASAHQWLEEAEQDYIMMAYLPGEEYGIFYYRYPGEPGGSLLSINRKKLLSVTGDGVKTLEELILADDRAVCMAPLFLKNHQVNLLDIIPAGQSKLLGEVGTHCRGALFLDACELITPQLLETIEQVVADYRGFYFGRFDLKAPSDEDLREGKNIKVIELNGVTSEAAHIYDPKHSVFYGWKTLIRQWSIAFEIADVNRQRGLEPMGLKDFIRHFRRAGSGGGSRWLDPGEQPGADQE